MSILWRRFNILTEIVKSIMVSDKEGKANAKFVFKVWFIVTVALGCILSLAFCFSKPDENVDTQTDVRAIIASSAESGPISIRKSIASLAESHSHGSIRHTILDNIDYFPFPTSYSVFAKHSDVIENPIPLLFDVSGVLIMQFLVNKNLIYANA